MSLIKFPKLQSTDQTLNLVQDNLIRTLNPVFDTPTLGGQILTKVPLVIGSNSINHKLGRNLVGWQIVRQRALASIYDTQDTNTTPSITLNLVSDAIVVVDLYVF